MIASGQASTPTRPQPATERTDPSPLELGKRIKLLRVARGLTLKDLEERGGISATHVSEIERGRASPTVGAFGRIAQALGVRPATLLEPGVVQRVTVTRASDRPGLSVQWSAATLESLTTPVPGANVGAQIMTLPLGLEPALEHRHEGEEWVTVLSGAVEIRIEDETYEVREGDSLHFRADRLHSYVNPASSPAVLLIASKLRLYL